MRHLLFFLPLLFLISVSAFADEQYSLMKFDLEQIQKMKKMNAMTLRATSFPMSSSPKKVNLLKYVSTVGEIRNQLKCANCWVWTGMATLEVRKNIYDKVSTASPNNSFSIGFMNAFFNDGGRNGKFACNGGTFEEFVGFFNNGEAKRRIIPWSNVNADFVDGDGGQEYLDGHISNRTKEEIEISPYYLTSNITYKAINVDNLTDAEVIQTIKSNVGRQYPVVLGFFLATKEDWNDLFDFWRNGSDEEIFDFGSRAEDSNMDAPSGHGLVIVGYDDTSSNPDEHYWLALNSWGVSNGHPKGTLRLKMNTNYKSVMNFQGDTIYKMNWGVLDPSFVSEEFYFDKKLVSGKLIDVNGSGVSDVAVKFNGKDTVLTDKDGLFSFPDAEVGRNYKLNFVRAGYKFNPKSYFSRVNNNNNYVEVGVENDPAYAKCVGEAIAVKAIGDNVKVIQKLAETTLDKINNRASYEEKLETLKRNYNNAFYSYPRVRYTCPSECEEVSYSESKTKLKRAIKQLAQMTKFFWNTCLRQNHVSANNVAKRRKLILLKRNKAIRQVGKLPEESAICK